MSQWTLPWTMERESQNQGDVSPTDSVATSQGKVSRGPLVGAGEAPHSQAFVVYFVVSCFKALYLDILDESLSVGYFEFFLIIDFCAFLVLSIMRAIHAWSNAELWLFFSMLG